MLDGGVHGFSFWSGDGTASSVEGVVVDQYLDGTSSWNVVRLVAMRCFPNPLELGSVIKMEGWFGSKPQ